MNALDLRYLRETQAAADGSIRPDITSGPSTMVTTRLRTERILRPLATHPAVSVRPFSQLNEEQQSAFAGAQAARLNAMRARLISDGASR